MFRAPGSTQFDYQSHIQKPFDLLPGGYISVFDVTAGTGWQQITAQGTPIKPQMRAPIGSRRERRRTPRDQWLKSTLKSRMSPHVFLIPSPDKKHLEAFMAQASEAPASGFDFPQSSK